MNDINKRLRYLEIYAAVSLIVFGVLAFFGFYKIEGKIVEIDVERLNVREKKVSYY